MKEWQIFSVPLKLSQLASCPPFHFHLANNIAVPVRNIKLPLVTRYEFLLKWIPKWIRFTFLLWEHLFKFHQCYSQLYFYEFPTKLKSKLYNSTSKKFDTLSSLKNSIISHSKLFQFVLMCSPLYQHCAAVVFCNWVEARKLTLRMRTCKCTYIHNVRLNAKCRKAEGRTIRN